MTDEQGQELSIAISVITPGPYVKVWSGTPFFLTEALKAVPGVRVHVTSPPLVGAYHIARIVSGLTGRILRRRFNWEVEPQILRLFTSALRRQWRRAHVDAVLAMGWMPAGLRREDPAVLFWGDASLAQRIDRAPHWSGISGHTRRLAEKNESILLQKLDGVIMPSSWAVNDVTARCGIPPERVHRVPFGANISDPGERARRAPGLEIRLLSIGVEWHRKGLDKVVLAADELAGMGYSVHLDVVGALPPTADWHRPYVTFHGFLSKDDPASARKLDDLYNAADFFVLASRSDPSPMVLGEAGAYCLPVIASSVDGIPERVNLGGVLIPPEGGGREYADAIHQVLTSGSYESLSSGSRRDFEALSNWATHVNAVIVACRDAIKDKRRLDR